MGSRISRPIPELAKKFQVSENFIRKGLEFEELDE
jgi:hypothetical protein